MECPIALTLVEQAKRTSLGPLTLVVARTGHDEIGSIENRRVFVQVRKWSVEHTKTAKTSPSELWNCSRLACSPKKAQQFGECEGCTRSLADVRWTGPPRYVSLCSIEADLIDTASLPDAAPNLLPARNAEGAENVRSAAKRHAYRIAEKKRAEQSEIPALHSGAADLEGLAFSSQRPFRRFRDVLLRSLEYGISCRRTSLRATLPRNSILKRAQQAID